MRIFKRIYFSCKLVSSLFVFAVLLYIASNNTLKRSTSLPHPHINDKLIQIYKDITLNTNKTYFLDGVAYDFYSINEMNSRSEPGPQWKTFPLPNEQIPPNITPWMPHNLPRNKTTSIYVSTPSETTTGLAFVDHIYITSVTHLTDRQNNLEKMFARYSISNYEWRMKWTRETCNALNNKEEVYRKLNLVKNDPLDKIRFVFFIICRLMMNILGGKKEQRVCSLTMKHVDIWHDIVARNSSLSLILEDDAVFVSNFREKFDRTIYTAIRTGALKIGGLARCAKSKSRLPRNSSEWFEQDPMIVIGSCLQIHDKTFAKNRSYAPPMLSTHKIVATRCAHAYLLTACSARALLRQMNSQSNTFLLPDILQNVQGAASPTLQAFWLDPPIAYQGNRIIDLDEIPSFKRTTY